MPPPIRDVASRLFASRLFAIRPPRAVACIALVCFAVVGFAQGGCQGRTPTDMAEVESNGAASQAVHDERVRDERVRDERVHDERDRDANPPDASPTSSPAAARVADSSAPARSDSQSPAQPDNPLRAASAKPAGAASAAAGEDAGSASSLPSRLLFDGWPQPRAALFITGQQDGYIEPCGCTGLATQKGGLARRHTLAKHLRERGWDLIPLDAGSQVRRFGRQPEVKFQMTASGLDTIGYQAVVLGVDDLQLSSGELLAVTMGAGDEPSMFVCANAAVLDPTLMPAFRIVEAGGVKVGITAVVSAESQKKVNSDDILFEPPEAAIGTVLPDLKSANCDVLVLMVHGSGDAARKLSRQFPDFQVVVVSGGPSDPAAPPYQPPRVEGSDALLVFCGIKGMHVGVVGIFDDSAQPLRYERVVLDARYEDSPEMLQLLASYQDQLEALGLEALGLRPTPHPSGHQFVGSEKCGECHPSAFAVWEESAHAHATQSLIEPGERTEIARHFDPECLSCHVTGWHPQRFYPYASGYLSLAKTPHLVGNGCENCHGPGSQHVAMEEGEIDATDEMIAALRAQMRLPLAEAEQSCMQCHDLDNSPAFLEEGAFERYWKNGIEH